MKIMVTGAAGFIGYNLTRELVKRGHEVIAVAYPDITENLRLLSKKGLQVEQADIRDSNTIGGLLKRNGVGAVFHLAAQLHYGESANHLTCFDANTVGTLNMLATAQQNGVETFIYSSSMSVYSEPPVYLPVDESHPTVPHSLYGISKMCGEVYCNLYANRMNIIILRYGGAFGQGQMESNAIPKFIKQALTGSPLTINNPAYQSSDFVPINDIVQGTILAWQKNETGPYNIGSGRETMLTYLASLIIDMTNSKSTIALVGKTNRPFRFYMDISRARKRLGYCPSLFEYALETYIKELTSEVKE
jgi:UDP-glucose 4-epimerase